MSQSSDILHIENFADMCSTQRESVSLVAAGRSLINISHRSSIFYPDLFLALIGERHEFKRLYMEEESAGQQRLTELTGYEVTSQVITGSEVNLIKSMFVCAKRASGPTKSHARYTNKHIEEKILQTSLGGRERDRAER